MVAAGFEPRAKRNAAQVLGVKNIPNITCIVYHEIISYTQTTTGGLKVGFFRPSVRELFASGVDKMIFHKRVGRMRYRNNILVILTAISITAILLTAGCAKQPVQVQIYVPPEYLNSIDVTPEELAGAYTLESHGDWTEPNRIFQGKSVVFKNLELTDRLLQSVDKGFIMLVGVKLELANPEDWSQFSSGSKVDVVGICKGFDMFEETAYVTLTGVIGFPAGEADFTSGGGDIVLPGY